jgi:hypothetical protein
VGRGVEGAGEVSTFLTIFGVIWLCGWIASYFETSACQEPTLAKKIFAALQLLFVWPIIACAKWRAEH